MVVLQSWSALAQLSAELKLHDGPDYSKIEVVVFCFNTEVRTIVVLVCQLEEPNRHQLPVYPVVHLITSTGHIRSNGHLSFSKSLLSRLFTLHNLLEQLIDLIFEFAWLVNSFLVTLVEQAGVAHKLVDELLRHGLKRSVVNIQLVVSH